MGGPVYIPGHWNQGKTKMFAFYNLEQALISTPGSLNSYTMPTALERQGDFSQTLDVSGKVIPITDTLAGAHVAAADTDSSPVRNVLWL